MKQENNFNPMLSEVKRKLSFIPYNIPPAFLAPPILFHAYEQCTFLFNTSWLCPCLFPEQVVTIALFLYSGFQQWPLRAAIER